MCPKATCGSLWIGGHSDDLVECGNCDRTTTRLGAFTRGWRLRDASGGIHHRCPDCL